MSIYTITLKRELLSAADADSPTKPETTDRDRLGSTNNDQEGRRNSRTTDGSIQARGTNNKQPRPAASSTQLRPANDTNIDSSTTTTTKQSPQVSSAQPIVLKSVNVTLELTVDNLSQPHRIVWLKGSEQITSSERPILFAKRRQQNPVANNRTKRTRSIKRTVSKKRSTSSTGFSIEETVSIQEEVDCEDKENSQLVAAAASVAGQEQEEELELVEEKKCQQESSQGGSKLTIYNLQDDDYGQYTCKLINDLDEGEQSKEQDQSASCCGSRNFKTLRGSSVVNKMDEVIEVKEGDFNIELGIQILPETNDDEELMSEEEKADFIDNTTITWFKDDVKLDQQDPEVKKLFQFTFDKQEGFHRLIVRKATKETEGVYSCLVENESGTSSCSTQLVVGPGNKPKLTSGLQDVTVYVGQSLEFRVKSTGLPPIDSCQWFKDDELLIELDNSSTETISSSNSRVKMSRHEEYNETNERIIIFRLCIENLKLEDTGRLKCRLINEYGYDETECFVKVLQEIIEEHEEVEEHIEEITHLGGGKKSREEETIEEEELIEEQLVKRQRQEVDQMEVDTDSSLGQRPRFIRKLSDKSVTSTTTETHEELIVSTERNKWTESEDSMRVRWFEDGEEILSSSSNYRIENFFNQTSQEWQHKLVITRRLRRESTQITCRASNQFGEDETSCRIERRTSSLAGKTKPRFLRSLEDIESYVGDKVTMKVAVDNSSESNRIEDLSFIKDGRLIYSSKRDGEREFSASSNSASRIKVRTYEETITVEDEEETTTTSRYYSRRRSSQLSSASQKGKRAKVFELTIENTQVDQMGSWQCQASNEAGTSECKADLEVFAEPKIVTDLPESVRVSPQREIRLTVEASGSPTPVYSWFKDGLGIAEEEDRVFTETKSSRTTTKRRTSVTSMREEDGVSISGETLIIRDARPEDAGSYECKIENRLGQVKSRTCKLTVIGHGDDLNRAPRIIKDLGTQTIVVEEDENVTLKVLAEGQPRPSQHWFKDDVEIITTTTTTTTTTTRNEHFEAENDGQEYKLKIKRSRDVDSGKYKVILRNEHGEVESQTVEVKVKKVTDEGESQRRPSAPTIMLDSQDKTVGLGSNVSFDVQVGGHPKPFITWYKNGRRLTESSDGRVTFVEEETTTTTVIEEREEGQEVGSGKKRTIKEISTVHKLVIRDVKDSDEAIYSLKAENDYGSTKSSLVSLTVDRRKESVDELRRHDEQETLVEEQQVEEEIEEEETTTTTVTTTKTKSKRSEKEEQEDDEEEEVVREERRSERGDRVTRTTEEEVVEDDEDDDSSEGGKKKITTRTTTKKTTKTTTSTTTEEQEEEEEEARRRKLVKEQEEEESSERQKRRFIDEQEDEHIEETLEEDETSRRRRVTKMDVDEEEEIRRDDVVEDDETIRKKRSKSTESERKEQRRRDSSDVTKTTVDEQDEEEEEETIETERRSRKPRVLSAPRKVVAGLGSSPELEVEIETITTTTVEETVTKVTWLKDGQEISSRQLRDNHIEIVEKSTNQPGVKKHILRINSLRSSDAGKYKLRAENVDGTTETEDIEVQIDRSMRPGEKPAVTPAEIRPQSAAPVAPEVVSVPEEVVAGIGSSPVIEAEIKGQPKPETTWFKDGQPISPDGHVEITEQPTDQPDVTRQQLKINDLKPADVAAYHIKAENPEGEVESEPTNLRIDRSMGPKDEPIVTGGPTPMEVDEDQAPVSRPDTAKSAPKLPSQAQEVKAPLGSSPVLEVPIVGGDKPTDVQWLKDGKPIAESNHLSPETSPDGKVQKLTINEMRPSDEGVYTLKAANEAGEVESAPIKVIAEKRRPSEAAAEPVQSAPSIISFPEEVVAGRGASPEVIAEVEGLPKPEITWFKDGQPITKPQLRDGHLEIVEIPTENPNVTKQALKINDLKPVDVAAYHIKAVNPLGEVESEPTNVRIDRSMGPRDEPVVTGVAPSATGEQPLDLASKKRPSVVGDQVAPSIISIPDEIVAGPGGKPEIVAEVVGKPAPEITWFKDGQPITKPQLRDGHLEIVEIPTENPDVTKQALKINNLRPADVAAYHIKAENPVGEVESEPTNVRIDRTMGPRDEPVVTGVAPSTAGEQPTDLAAKKRPSVVGDRAAPSIISMPDEIVAGPGSKPEIVAEVAGKPAPEITWFKDGQPITKPQLRDGHLEIVEIPTENPNITKQALRINDLKRADVASYHIKAENPLGEVESQPTSVRLDRSMGPRDEPVVTGSSPSVGELPKDLVGQRRPSEVADKRKPSVTDKERPTESAPSIVSFPEEVVAGRGASPQVIAEVEGLPKPEITWFKDGQPITKPQLRDGHLEIVEIPTENPNVTKQALKINDLKPSDVAAYHIKAANPLGEVESEPTNVRIDRSMGPRDEPVVTGVVPSATGEQPADLAAKKRPSTVGDQVAPSIISMPDEIVAGPGGKPEIVAEVAGKPAPEITWFKDGQPITKPQLRDGHLEIVDIPTDNPDVTKQALKINDLKPADVAAYHIKAENPVGEVESEPTNVRIDRTMGPRDEPVITGVAPSATGERPADLAAKKRPSVVGDQVAPSIISMPDEIVAGPGSKPEIVAEVAGKPAPEITWFKDGQPITKPQLRDGHLEIVEIPTENPDVTKQALKINNLRPADVAAYHIKAENPVGEVESEPANVRIDRSMGPRDEPVVTGSTPAEADQPADLVGTGRRPSGTDDKRKPSIADQGEAPKIVSMPEEIVAGRLSSPQLIAEVAGQPEPEITWFKDGQPLSKAQLRDGHLEIVKLPSEKPNVTKQALQINELKLADVAAYHIKAENPLGQVESQPTNVKLDRSMSSKDEPIVRPVEAPQLDDSTAPTAPKLIGSVPEEVIAGLGSSPVLEATIEGQPRPEISWLKDGQPIRPNEHLEISEQPTDQPDILKQVLKINDLKPEDVGAYQVKATNPLGEVESEPIAVKVDRSMGPRDEPIVKPEPVAPEVVSVPEEVVAGIGSSPVIEAEIKGQPKPETTWFKDGQPISPDGHVEITEQPTDQPDVTRQQLKINDLKPADVAAYHIKAENPEGEVESEPTNLRIDRSMGPKDEPIVTGGPTPMEVDEDQAPVSRPDTAKSAPRLPSQAQEVKAPLGSSPVLEVPIVGGDKPTDVQWLKDGKPIAESNHLSPETSPDGKVQKLTINEMRPSDEGVYTLKAANEAGEVESAPIKVIAEKRRPSEAAAGPAQSAPSIVSFPEEVVAGRGASPQIVAEVAGVPKPEITWFKDDKPITKSQLRDGHLEIVEIPTDKPDVIKQALKINDFRPADVAAYHIKAENKLGDVESVPANVKLDRSMGPAEEPLVKQAETIAPEILSAPEEVVAGIGSSPVIEAEIKGQPKPETTWFKDGQPISPDGHVEITEQPTNQPDVTRQQLKINDLKPADVAAYHIKAENPEGEAESEPTNLRIDRSMGPKDEPIVTGGPTPMDVDQTSPDGPQSTKSLPQLSSESQEIRAPLKSSPVLEVPIVGGDKPTEVQWLKDGKPVADSNHLTLETSPDGKLQKLTINEMRPSDEGVYTLKAANEAGEVESAPIKVIAEKRRPSEAAAGPAQSAPSIVSFPEEVVAGRGASPEVIAEVEGLPKPEITWFKDGQPITKSQLRDGHLEIIEIPTENPNVTKQALKINDLKPSDVAAYHIKAANPLGEVESEPTNVRIDRSMGPRDEPVVTGVAPSATGEQPLDLASKKRPSVVGDQVAPSIISMPDEIVAGPGSKPEIVAEVAGKPAPEVTWFKDGQPITKPQLRDGHLEIVDIPTDNPDVTKQALKINNMKPSDVAAYHIKAENPLGEVESGPTNVRIDRTMGPKDEPVVTGAAPSSSAAQPADLAAKKRPSVVGDQVAPSIISMPDEIVAGPGSKPEIVAVVAGKPAPEITWFKDGKPIDTKKDGHLKVTELPASQPDAVKQVLLIDGLKPADVAAYHVEAKNPAGEATSQPTSVKLDRSMGPREEPVVVGAKPEESTESSPISRAAPRIVSMPREVVSGRGGSPIIEAVVTGQPKPEVVWFKDGQKISPRQLSDGHLEIQEIPTGNDDGEVRQVLKVNGMKPSDVAQYHVRAENPLGSVESEPASLKLSPSMGPRDEPVVVASDSAEHPATGSGPADLVGDDLVAPSILSVPEEIVAGVGSKPVLVVEVSGKPAPEIMWFKDGQPISDQDSHLRLAELPSSQPETVVKQALTIDGMKPADVAAYHVKAVNPLGEAESEPTNVRIDRSKGPDDDEILVTPAEAAAKPDELAEAKPKRKLRAPIIKRVPKQVVAAEGDSPVLEVEVSGEPIPEVVWLRNGQRIEKSNAHYKFEELPEEGIYRMQVKNVDKSDEAVYSIQATNEAGCVESGPIKLLVEPSGTGKSVAKPRGFGPKIIRAPKELVAAVGSSPVIEVELKASPKADLTWFKDGQPIVGKSAKFTVEEETIDKDTSRYVMTIHDLKPSDVGTYHFTAENTFGEVRSEPISVRLDDGTTAVAAGPTDQIEDKPKRRLRAPVIKRMPRKIVAAMGSSPVIEIEVSGEPRPEVVWFRNGQRVSEIRNHITIEEAPNGIYRLCFTNLKATDQAEYTITATNEAGTVESEPIQLIVDRTMKKSDEPFVQEATLAETLPDEIDGQPVEAPQILRLRDQEALPGQTVKLEAEVLGHPKPDIKWLKDGDEVELNIINQLPESNLHSLTLKNVNDLYDGVYSLEAKNIAGTTRKDARVNVVEQLSERAQPVVEEAKTKPFDETPAKRKEPEEREIREKPFIKRGLKFSQVNQGRTIKFEVQIDGKYDELIWMKDGEQINLPFEVSSTGSPGDDDDDETATLVGSDTEQDGELVTGDDLVSGKPKRRFPPRILIRPRNIVAGRGSRVAFEVSCSGEPKPELHWFKNGKRIEQTADGKIIIEEFSDGGVRLIIEDVQDSDIGEYHVVAENPYGNERTIPVTLEIDDDMFASDDLANTSSEYEPLKSGKAPRILSRPKSVHSSKGSRVAFEVQVSGEPLPIINWFRDGRLIAQTSDGHVTIEEYSNGCVSRLILADIGDSDVAQYHVVAENKHGSERTIPVTLTIDEQRTDTEDLVEEFEEISSLTSHELKRKRNGRPPRILLRPKNIQARPGSQVELEVSVVGQSKPSIIWYRNGKQIASTSDGHIRIEQITDNYQRLILTDVNETDAGQYSVSAENDFGVSMSNEVKMEVSSSFTEEITTTTTTETTETFYETFVSDGSADGDDNRKRRAPRFTVRPRNKKAPIGSKVDFEVRVTGEPKPDVVWYKNGRRIHTTSDGRVRVEEFSDGGSKLLIEDLEETDHGVYAAEAKNEWGQVRTEDVQLRVTQRTEVSEHKETTMRGSTKITTKTKKTRSHYTFAEERHGYVTLTLSDAQLEHDGDYKLIVRNRWGEATTQAPLVVIPKVEPRSTLSMDRSGTGYEDSSLDGRDSRARRTPFDELEDYGHELDKSVGVFGSESRYQSGDDTYLLQLRDTEFPLRLRKYLRFGARQSPSLRSNLMDAHWGAGARVTVRERRKFREVMDEEIDDEKRGLDLRPTPMRLQKEVGTCGYAAAQLEHLRVEAAERVARRSQGKDDEPSADEMMPPFFREKLKDAVVEEAGASQQQVAVFACLAAGQPKPEYTWFRNDIIITNEATLTANNRMQVISRPDGGSELHVRDPRLQDSGCFKCVARNVHGNVTCRARLRVASRPSRPEPPEYVSVTSREVFLQWRPPRDYDTNAAEVLGYKLEMSQSSIGQEDKWSVLGADIGHEFYVVDDLTPGTSYSFRISARNKFGWSDSSYSTYVTTARDGSDAAGRLQVPHEMRARQYTSDICDSHQLRTGEDPKRPQMNYQLELSPVQLKTNENWLDHYTLQTEIARGRFSVISKAASKSSSSSQDDDNEQPAQVVVKTVLVESMSAAQTKNEFDIMRSLQHEKVVGLHVAFKTDDMFVFVLERLSGLDVLTYLSSYTTYNEETVSRIITQVMDAIEYLHFRGMCLLELLPDNVVMTNGRSTSIKLVDFSSARFVPRSGARVPLNTSQNIEYCPPEVIANHEVSTASDVWCIGVLTYVLLSGFSPFKGDSEDETRENVRLGRYKYDHIYGNCTPEVTRFLINVFKKHSSKRPTIEQLYENKWLLPNEFMIRKRQQAIFKTDKIVAFAEEFHKLKQQQTPPQKLIDILGQASG